MLQRAPLSVAAALLLLRPPSLIRGSGRRGEGGVREHALEATVDLNLGFLLGNILELGVEVRGQESLVGNSPAPFAIAGGPLLPLLFDPIKRRGGKPLRAVIRAFELRAKQGFLLSVA
ncbi:hypothetical protein MLD38_007829 [Melastoma candidum]|uniref:Uncharacterized protein n=1 Tax=Melastoma candidum TaxID=119954 RepID=A0ACB9RTP2_9MYRT|nr:hypothetical protein MLD38_007829 [Melastoma candidum]